jgi:hypothetical protein
VKYSTCLLILKLILKINIFKILAQYNTMKRYTNTNIFSVLSEPDKDFTIKFPSKITHLELHPVAKLIKYRNITHLEPHPTSYLIKFVCIYNSILYKNKVRFNDLFYIWDYKDQHRNPSYLINRRNDDAYHDDILLKSEIDRIKEELDLKNKKFQMLKNIKFKMMEETDKKIDQILDDCKTMCAKWLDQIHICKCEKCDNCKNNEGIDKFDLGRCRHYYQIERLQEENEYDQEDIQNYTEQIWDIESRYERELAKKQKYLDKYERDLEEEYEDWAFDYSLRYSDYQRNYKHPKYVY